MRRHERHQWRGGKGGGGKGGGGGELGRTIPRRGGVEGSTEATKYEMTPCSAITTSVTMRRAGLLLAEVHQSFSGAAPRSVPCLPPEGELPHRASGRHASCAMADLSMDGAEALRDGEPPEGEGPHDAKQSAVCHQRGGPHQGPCCVPTRGARPHQGACRVPPEGEGLLLACRATRGEGCGTKVRAVCHQRGSGRAASRPRKGKGRTKVCAVCHQRGRPHQGPCRVPPEGKGRTKVRAVCHQRGRAALGPCRGATRGGGPHQGACCVPPEGEGRTKVRAVCHQRGRAAPSVPCAAARRGSRSSSPASA